MKSIVGLWTMLFILFYILSILLPISVLFGLFLNYVIYGFLSTIVMQTLNSPFFMQVVHKSHVGKWNSIVKLFLFWNLLWTCASTLIGVFKECCQTLWWSCWCLVAKTFCEAMLSYVARNCEALLLNFHPKLWNFVTKVSFEVVKLYCIGVIWSYVVEEWSCETLWDLCMCMKSMEFGVIMCAKWCKTWFLKFVTWHTLNWPIFGLPN
jgi:hypothetical protein